MFAVAEHSAFEDGGAGTTALAEAVEQACRQPAAFRPLYGPEQGLTTKMQLLATRLYGAAEVRWSSAAEEAIHRFEAAGYRNLLVCVAKTHLSLSYEPTQRGAPAGNVFPITDARLAAGAGYVYVMAGDIMTMPGLLSHARASEMDIDSTGQVVGLL